MLASSGTKCQCSTSSSKLAPKPACPKRRWQRGWVQRHPLSPGWKMRLSLANTPHLLPRLKNTPRRSEEHTSELQSRENLVCRLQLEKKSCLIRQKRRVYIVFLHMYRIVCWCLHQCKWLDHCCNV